MKKLTTYILLLFPVLVSAQWKGKPCCTGASETNIDSIVSIYRARIPIRTQSNINAADTTSLTFFPAERNEIGAIVAGNTVQLPPGEYRITLKLNSSSDDSRTDFNALLVYGNTILEIARGGNASGFYGQNQTGNTFIFEVENTILTNYSITIYQDTVFPTVEISNIDEDSFLYIDKYEQKAVLTP